MNSGNGYEGGRETDARGPELNSSYAGLTRVSNLEKGLSKDGLPGQAHGCPARFLLEKVHDIDSA
jgi:hypothetical protein